MSMHVVGIECYSTRKIGFSLKTLIIVHQFATLQEIVISTPLLGRLLSHEFGTMSSDASLQSGGDCGGHFCLNCKNVFDGSVVSTCPKMPFSFSVDKLSRNSDVCSKLANAPLDDIADAKLLSHRR